MTEKEILELILEKVTVLEQKVEAIDKRLTLLEEKVDRLEQKVEAIDKRLTLLEAKVDRLEEKVTELDGNSKIVHIEVARTNSKVERIEKKLSHVQLMMENELRVNIQRVAEGHLDLARNTAAALNAYNALENLSIKVDVLETDVRDIKRKIS